MTIGQRIKRIREFRGMTQKELGRRLGVRKGCDVRIAQYESGKRVPKQKILKQLAQVLEVSESVFSPTIGISHDDLIQTIFWWDDMKGGGDIHDCIEEWETMRNKRNTGEISEEDYFRWKITYGSSPTALMV